MSKTLSNTSPLYYLHQLSLLELLPLLFKEIVVPQAVVDELNEGRRLGHQVPDVAVLPWIEVRPVEISAQLEPHQLGPGELHVLSLALEIPESLVLLDDRDARAAAALHGIRMVGTVGILLLGQAQGKISHLAPELDRLRAAGFYLSEPFYQRLLRDAGESD